MTTTTESPAVPEAAPAPKCRRGGQCQYLVLETLAVCTKGGEICHAGQGPYEGYIRYQHNGRTVEVSVRVDA